MHRFFFPERILRRIIIAKSLFATPELSSVPVNQNLYTWHIIFFKFDVTHRTVWFPYAVSAINIFQINPNKRLKECEKKWNEIKSVTYWKRLRIKYKKVSRWNGFSFIFRITPLNWSNLFELAHKIYITIDSIATISCFGFFHRCMYVCPWHKSVFWIQFHLELFSRSFGIIYRI